MASKNISFDQIPASIRKPGKYFEFNTRLAVRTLPANAQKLLIIAQRLAAGSVAALVPTQLFSDSDAAGFFGAGSMAHLMCRAAITANPYLQLSVCALDDAAGGSSAVGTVTITGPATGPGVLRLYIGNRRIEIAIVSGAVQNDIATALNTAIGVYGDLPVTAGAATNVVTCTARNKGTVGNSIGLAVEITAPGITVAIVAMANGAVDPDFSTATAKVFPGDYTIIASPYTDATALGILKTHLDNVSGPMEQRPATAYIAQTGALGTATTLGGTLNHGRILLALLRATRSIPYEVAAAYAAVAAGEEDPARPLNTLPLTAIAAPAIADRLSRTEQEACLANGVAPLEVGPGENVQIVRAISTYTKDANSIADIALLDITTIRTLDYVRLACRTRIALRFPREKLSSKTPPRVKSELLDVLTKLEDLEIVENVADNKDGLIVERDLQDPNRLDAKIPADVVNGLHVFAGRIDLLL
jgi:phage tail sheath gpL-like